MTGMLERKQFRRSPSETIDMRKNLLQVDLPTGQSICLIQGDITAETTEAIVNAANKHLQHGGGVAGVIAQRGGPTIQDQSDQWVRKHGPVTHERPAWTSGGNLPARYVIHAVGPVWGEGDEDAKLNAAVSGSLKVADELQLRSITFPAISTGIFGFPKRRAAEIIYEAIQAYFTAQDASGIEEVRVVLYDQSTLEIFLDRWRELQAQ